MFVADMNQRSVRYATAALRPGTALRRTQNAAAEESSETRDKQEGSGIEVGCRCGNEWAYV